MKNSMEFNITKYAYYTMVCIIPFLADMIITNQNTVLPFLTNLLFIIIAGSLNCLLLFARLLVTLAAFSILFIFIFQFLLIGIVEGNFLLLATTSPVKDSADN